MAKRTRPTAATPAAPRLTKRQVSRHQREQQQRRILYATMATAAVVILGLIGYAILREQVLLPNETILTVNGTDVSRNAYWKMRRFDLGQQMQQLQFQAQFGGGGNQQAIQQRMAALQNELRQYKSSPLDVPTVEKLANNLLLVQKASGLGVIADEAAIQAEVEREFAPPPATPTPVTTAESTQTAVAATAVATLTPPPATATTTIAPVTGTPEPTATPTLGPTVTSTPFVTPTPTITPTAMSEAARATAGATFRNTASDLRRAYGMSAEDYRDLVVRPQLLERLVKEKLAERALTDQPQVRAAHILVETEEAAKEVKAELDKGADFARLARERSTDPGSKDKGGDLDWFPRGIMAAEFEKAAFSQELGVVGEPFQTQFGWHIVKVLEKDDARPVTPNLLTQTRETAYDAWLKEQRAASSVKAAVTLPSFAPTPTPEPAAATPPAKP